MVEQEEAELKDTYLTERVFNVLSLKEEQNRFDVSTSNRDQRTRERHGEFFHRILFQADDQDNIIINYHNLLGDPYQFRKNGNKHAEPFVRKRLKIPVPTQAGGLMKYQSPKGSTMFPFFNPSIIEKYQKKIKIPVLFMVEGEFKSVAGWLRGLDIIGLPSIHGFYDGDHRKRLHIDIEDLISTCDVEKLVFITDADTLTINYKPDKDLYSRPASFYSAAATLRDCTFHMTSSESHSLQDVYFGHLHTKFNDVEGGADCKGLDDLFHTHVGEEEAIIKDLMELGSAGSYFKIMSLSTINPHKLRTYFGITHATEFATTYKDFIQRLPFVFKRRHYYFDDDGMVRYIKHKDVDSYMRVKDKWYRVIDKPDKHGDTVEEILKWNKGEIREDYKKYPGFLDDVVRYKSFCNVPDNSPQYQSSHHDCFNLYRPLKHGPQPGDIISTLKFIKHLFRGDGNVTIEFDPKTSLYKINEDAILGDPFTVMLDWLTLCYREPKQQLPVPCLVSPEKGTGKSTFLKWMCDIYGTNATITGNEQFKMAFNSHYITKHIIGIDEGFIEVDKKAEKERLKKLATDDRQFLQFKGVDLEEFDFYGKMVICSNDADRLMKMEEGEIRWFVTRVIPFERDNEDPLLRDKMRGEIPAFLHFLNTREIAHPRQGRAWFHPKYLVTEQMKAIIEETKTRWEKILEEVVREMFLIYKLATFKCIPRPLAQLISERGKFKADENDIRGYLKKKGMLPGEPSKYRFPIGLSEGPESKMIINWSVSTLGRCYVFTPEQWLNEVEMVEYAKPSEHLLVEPHKSSPKPKTDPTKGNENPF